MALLALVVVAGGGGVAAMLVGRSRPGIGAAVGVATALAVISLTIAMPAEDSVGIGSSRLILTDLVRSLAIVWAACAVVLALLELGIGATGTTGPGLLALAVAVAALAATDPFTAFAALAAGGLAGVVVPGAVRVAGGSGPVKVQILSRGAFAVLAAGLLAIGVVAWGASPIGPIGGGPFAGVGEGRIALGVGLLTMVGAVALRTGLIPLHVWAARFMEGVTPLAIPAAFAWGGVAFVITALTWSQFTIGPSVVAGGPERLIIVAVALTSIAFGGLAALIHDDVEHILGYSILQDAGVAVLAFATLGTEEVAAARTWLVASATAKTALAAWAAVTRASFGEHRLAELGGWARRAPSLGVAFGLIWLAAVGLPGTALFDARTTLVFGALPGLLGVVVLVLSLTPLGYLGRVAAAGIAPVSGAVTGVSPATFRLAGQRAGGWKRASARHLARAVPVGIRENRVPFLAGGVVVLAAIAVVVSVAGRLA